MINHKDSETALRVWFKKTRNAKWKNLTEMKRDFPAVDFVGNNRFVFDIKGNNYRIVVLAFFTGQKVFIRFVGTHAAYDKINASII